MCHAQVRGVVLRVTAADRVRGWEAQHLAYRRGERKTPGPWGWGWGPGGSEHTVQCMCAHDSIELCS